MTATRGPHLVQNTAARDLSRTQKFDLITPVLIFLRWLPIQAGGDLKILLQTYKAINGLPPLSSFRGRAFAHRARLLLWNRLPLQILEAGSFDVFKTWFKTHLFSMYYALVSQNEPPLEFCYCCCMIILNVLTSILLSFLHVCFGICLSVCVCMCTWEFS